MFTSKTLRSVMFAVVLMITGCQSVQLPPPSAACTVVYVHGFGGRRVNPYFLREMRDFQKEADVRFELINHHWDSGKLRVNNVKQAGPLWRTANLTAEKEAVKLSKTIKNLEARGQPYYLTGHSLGTKVISLALNQHGGQLKGCRGIYFMGSALPKGFELKRGVLPKGMKIVNYHSEDYDFVLDYSFRTAEGLEAGGQVGFDDTSVFDNRPVSCTHARKPGIHSDYTMLAEAIGYQVLWKQGIEVPGSTKVNWKTKVGEGNHFWNTILAFDDVTVGKEKTKVVIQQHKVTLTYRAVSVDGDKRRRIAWSGNLHAVLKALGLWERRNG